MSLKLIGKLYKNAKALNLSREEILVLARLAYEADEKGIFTECIDAYGSLKEELNMAPDLIVSICNSLEKRKIIKVYRETDPLPGEEGGLLFELDFWCEGDDE